LASVSAEAAVRAALTTEGQMVVLPPHGVFVGGTGSAYGPDVLPGGGVAVEVAEPSSRSALDTKVAFVGLTEFKGLKVRIGSLFPNGVVDLDELTPVAAADVQAALGNPASDLAVATSRVVAAHAHYTAVRAALTTEGQMVVLPPHGVFVGGRGSAYGPDVLPVGGVAVEVAEPSSRRVLDTKVAFVGLTEFKGLKVTLRALFPNRVVDLDELTPVAAADVQAALGNPASDLAVATSRVVAAHAHYTAVRAAAVAAADLEQDARMARVEVPGPDDALSVPAGPRCTARAPASSARRHMSLC
jgi:hypothetical protein